ncbi:MAG: carboxypeptidase regulatory-like domain-containing protein [Candidatus Aenigmarchaeota archaeon]|nr:carboxypeptidase regulatory-like domain-containing protein [Candidatus Aenigmarchaeota archaeon]
MNRLHIGLYTCLIFSIVTTQFASAGIFGPPIPFPFAEKVYIDGKPAANFTVIVTNANTGYNSTEITNEAGEFVIDFANFQGYAHAGDLIEVSICKTENDCVPLEFRINDADVEHGFVSSQNINIDWNESKYELLPADLKTLANIFKDGYERLQDDNSKLRSESTLTAIITLAIGLVGGGFGGYLISRHFYRKGVKS